MTDLLPTPTTGQLALGDRRPLEPQRLSALDDLVRGFLLSKRSAKTRDAYAADLASWLTFCARLGVDPLAAGIHHADAYLRLSPKPVTPAAAAAWPRPASPDAPRPCTASTATPPASTPSPTHPSPTSNAPAPMTNTPPAGSAPPNAANSAPLPAPTDPAPTP